MDDAIVLVEEFNCCWVHRRVALHRSTRLLHRIVSLAAPGAAPTDALHGTRDRVAVAFDPYPIVPEVR